MLYYVVVAAALLLVKSYLICGFDEQVVCTAMSIAFVAAHMLTGGMARLRPEPARV